MKKYLFAALPFLGFGPAFSGGTVIAPFVTSSEQLVAVLSKSPGPVAIQVGSGYKAAALRLEYRCMSVDPSRAGWYDKHVDNGNCIVVIVISDTSRATQ